MINLIKNELFKVFHKKSIYVFGIIILGFCIINNVSYLKTYDEEGNYIYDGGVYYMDYSDALNKLDPSNEIEVDEYIEVKTSSDIENMLKTNNYDGNSWQYSVTYDVLYSYAYNINYYTYKEKDNAKLLKYREEYDKLIDKLMTDDWKYFAKIELDRVNEDIKSLEKDKINFNTTALLKNYEENLYRLNFEKEILELRLNKDISYGYSYLNTALEEYENTSNSLYNLKNKNNLTYDDKITIQRWTSDVAINKYIVDTKYNLEKENNLRSGIKDLIDDYEVFIMVFIIIISAGIVSSEFKDGTIKLLLTKPYTRSTILLSKYLTCIICFGLIIVYTFICQFIVGSLCFGIDSLEIPVVIYNYSSNSLMEYNAFSYLFLMIVCKMPMYILMLTLAFSLSTLFLSSSLANTFSILGYLFKDMVIVFVTMFRLDFLKYFVTLNWNFTEYLFGKLPSIEGLTIGISIVVCIVFYLAMLITTFAIFKKKNIKNI